MASVITHPLQESEYENLCPITLVTYKTLAEQNSLVLTACGHKFSRLHIKEWVEEKSPTCPVCVKKIDNNFIPVSLAIDSLSKNRLQSATTSKSTTKFKPREATRKSNKKKFGFLPRILNRGRGDLNSMIRHSD